MGFPILVRCHLYIESGSDQNDSPFADILQTVHGPLIRYKKMKCLCGHWIQRKLWIKWSHHALYQMHDCYLAETYFLEMLEFSGSASIFIKKLLKFVLSGQLDNISALIHVMVLHCKGASSDRALTKFHDANSDYYDLKGHFLTNWGKVM